MQLIFKEKIHPLCYTEANNLEVKPMALKVNTKTDWGEMFDKFAVMPDEKVATGPDPKHQAEQAKKAKAKAAEQANKAKD
ncbi:hypothetical protein FD02_GL001111 [Lacticaseibacillus nasuensis JCM 17158]|uniref:Uncharacterized protein n=2 Tax=Lacticaseibacillus TaxID=2759736 RepID=A0A0R1JP80_9LACO|nr:hypothetical protein FD02_GL001111 [Lacticaseibacillus nasuensis JCM 17158]